MKLVLNRLIWIMGMVGIIWAMPVRFEKIAHERQEDIIGFCGHGLVSTFKNEILVRNIDTFEMRRIPYPGAAWLYTGSKPQDGSCHLIPARHWLCGLVTEPGSSRLDVIDLGTGQCHKRCQLPCAPKQWGVT